MRIEDAVGFLLIVVFLFVVVSVVGLTGFSMYSCYAKHGVTNCKVIEGNGQIVIK